MSEFCLYVETLIEGFPPDIHSTTGSDETGVEWIKFGHLPPPYTEGVLRIENGQPVAELYAGRWGVIPRLKVGLASDESIFTPVTVINHSHEAVVLIGLNAASMVEIPGDANTPAVRSMVVIREI